MIWRTILLAANLILAGSGLAMAAITPIASANPDRGAAFNTDAYCDAMSSMKYGEFMKRLDEIQRIKREPRATRAERKAAKRELAAIRSCMDTLVAGSKGDAGNR